MPETLMPDNDTFYMMKFKMLKKKILVSGNSKIDLAMIKPIFNHLWEMVL